jgi:type IV pilus assembly protein PilE
MSYKHSRGFTLIELMIVVAIIGILSSIAFGYFGDNVIAANRSEGRAELTATAASLEKCRSLYGAYNAGGCNVANTIATDTNYYSIDTTTRTASTYTLTANPVAGQPQANDADCTSLTLTNTGVKGGTGANSAECW